MPTSRSIDLGEADHQVQLPIEDQARQDVAAGDDAIVRVQCPLLAPRHIFDVADDAEIAVLDRLTSHVCYLRKED